MNGIIKVKHLNESFSVVSTKPESIKKEIAKLFKAHPDGYQFNPKYRMGMWDGYVNFFKVKDKYLVIPRGLVKYIKEFAEGYYHFEILNEPEKINPKKDVLQFIEEMKLPYELRDYQLKTILRAIYEKRGTYILATGCIDENTLMDCKLHGKVENKIKTYRNIFPEFEKIGISIIDLIVFEKSLKTNLRNYYEKIYRMYKKYDEISNLNFEKIKKITLNLKNREKKTIINYEYFELFCFEDTKNAYDKYCKLKTKKWREPRTSYDYSSKDYHIEKYGLEKGLKIYNKINEKKNTISIDYFMKKFNVSEKEARQLQKERQATFSLEKLMKKYPDNIAFQIWKSRQKKWQKTLKSKSKEEIEEMNKKKSMYFNVPFEDYLKMKRMSSKEEYKQKIIDDYTRYYRYFYDLEEFQKRYIIPYFKNEVIESIRDIPNFKGQGKYKKFSKTKYSFQKKVDEGLLRSSYEIKFYNLLKENNIEFELEKHYPNSRMRCDFYLPKKDMYIEIAGLKGNYEYDAKMLYKEYKFGAKIITNDKMRSFVKEFLK